jgi:hypothetical protein
MSAPSEGNAKKRKAESELDGSGSGSGSSTSDLKAGGTSGLMGLPVDLLEDIFAFVDPPTLLRGVIFALASLCMHLQALNACSRFGAVAGCTRLSVTAGRSTLRVAVGHSHPAMGDTQWSAGIL